MSKRGCIPIDSNLTMVLHACHDNATQVLVEEASVTETDPQANKKKSERRPTIRRTPNTINLDKGFSWRTIGTLHSLLNVQFLILTFCPFCHLSVNHFSCLP